jgi:hypothetical protein
MNRFARRLLAAIVIVPALLFADMTSAFAYTDPGAGGGGDTTFPPPPITTTGSGLAEHAQWMVAGAGLVLAAIAVYVAAMALVHRHQHVGSQLRSL